MKKLNIAVVGAGIYGKNHLDAFSTNPNVNLVAVCDLNKEITDRVSKEYGVKGYNDTEEMLLNEDIDAVAVATPDPYHKDPVMTAIKFKKDVLVEKPLATTSEDAYAMLAFMEVVPDWVMHGLEVAGGVMPAIGFALIMNMIGKPRMIPYTIIGFILVKVVGLNSLTAGLIAGCIAVLVVLDKRERAKEAA